MTLATAEAAVLLGVIAFTIGALPIIDWLVGQLAGKRLQTLGTGNISVSAAFYHGGTAIGLLAVLSEASKGIGVVLLARSLFAQSAPWEIAALVALVLGRFTIARGAGTTNVFWGYVTHDWGAALTIFLLAGGGFVIFRRRQAARLWSLALIPVMEGIRHSGSPSTVAAAIMLSLLLAWIYTQIPDDLALSSNQPSSASPMFQFLQGQDVIASLNDKPNAVLMGQKAATLAQLKQWGYAVPDGWILPSASDARSLTRHLESVEPTPWQQSWIVRSSAQDEDGSEASAAGQYQSIADIRSPEALERAVADCRAAYTTASAQQYRRDRGLSEQTGLALLVQPQIQGQFSGVAFSRDPVDQGAAVIVEALAGGAAAVVSGQVTPEQYRIEVDETTLADVTPDILRHCDISEQSANDSEAIPAALIQQVAQLARDLERRYHGIPQDIEWTFDGTTLWLLQARPITTLAPLWTRKIAAEVIPGVIRPLTWSINRPLTCGVWGQLFTIVLGDRAADLDFTETATLHYSRAYFNATLLGQIFRRMGLPAESLEFLTLGAKFGKPPISSTLKNVPGLLRLLRREWTLPQDFAADERQYFALTLAQLRQSSPNGLSPAALLQRLDLIFEQLEKATYYSILAPLSFSLRRSLFQISEAALDPSQQPEVASIQAVKALAIEARRRHPDLLSLGTLAEDDTITHRLFDKLSTESDYQTLNAELAAIVERYGYLSEVGTDVAVPTWQEDPQPVRELFAQFFFNPPPTPTDQGPPSASVPSGWRYRQVQNRLTLKGRVATIYLTLLAQLRWHLLALQQHLVTEGALPQTGDAFFLLYDELKNAVDDTSSTRGAWLSHRVTERRSRYEQDQALTTVPFIVYGQEPPPDPTASSATQPLGTGELQGIGASAGIVEGPVKVLTSMQTSGRIAPGTIIVVPYTDAGWAPVLAQAAGLIAEVGGKLSHGAIVAREYRIPAVMNIANATQQFHDGQRVRIDGRTGIVERLETSA